MVLIGWMPWPKTGATHYHVQFGLTDKVHAINKKWTYDWLILYIGKKTLTHTHRKIVYSHKQSQWQQAKKKSLGYI